VIAQADAEPESRQTSDGCRHFISTVGEISCESTDRYKGEIGRARPPQLIVQSAARYKIQPKKYTQATVVTNDRRPKTAESMYLRAARGKAATMPFSEATALCF